MLGKLRRFSNKKSKIQPESEELNLAEIVPSDKDDGVLSKQSQQREVKSVIDSHANQDTETQKTISKHRHSDPVNAAEFKKVQRASTFNRFSTQMQSFFANLRQQNESESSDESSYESKSEEIECEVPVNPMKTLLGTVSNNAFVSWSYLSKIIQAMEVVESDIELNSDEMNKVMLQQCIRLLKDSPYVLKTKDDKSLAHKSAKFYRKSETDENGDMIELKPKMRSSRRASVHAINHLRSKLVEFNTLPHGAASNDVSSFVQNMVQLHMDSAFNVFSENNGVITNNGVLNVPQPNTANDENEAKTAAFENDGEAMTMTQSNTVSREKKRRRSSAKGHTKKFAIDIGLSNELSTKIMSCLSNIDSWNDFNLFELFDIAGHMAMPILGIRILKEYDLVAKLNFNESKLINFFQCIQQIYNSEVPYHNEYHGGDVMATCFQIVKSRNKKFFNSDGIQLQNHELFSLFVGSMVHDVGHNGYNNDFHVKTESDLALLYNDVSVLENYHAATAWKLMALKENDFFGEGNSEIRNKIRKLSTDIILHTDMSKHNHIVGTLNALTEKTAQMESSDAPVEFSDAERSAILRSIVHTSDISNPAKKFDYMMEWTNRINNEFWKQGDKERELGFKVSPLCDRENPNVEKSQIGFGKFVVLPLIKKMQPFFGILDDAACEMNKNLEYWQAQLNLLNKAQERE